MEQPLVANRASIENRSLTTLLPSHSHVLLAATCGKPPDYYRQERPELRAFVPHEAKRILDIGCGEGLFAAGLRTSRRPAEMEIIGVELLSAAAAVARRNLDQVFEGSIESSDLPFNAYFDCIVCADVLEHLVDPWTTVRKVWRYLRPDGCLVASIPNVQHWRTVLNLVFGSWEYVGQGTMDVTHLRFFTRASIAALFHRTGYQVQALEANIPTKRGRFLNRVTAKVFEPFLAFQYVVVARRAVEIEKHGEKI